MSSQNVDHDIHKNTGVTTQGKMFVSSLEWQNCVEHHYAIDLQKQF